MSCTRKQSIINVGRQAYQRDGWTAGRSRREEELLDLQSCIHSGTRIVLLLHSRRSDITTNLSPLQFAFTQMSQKDFERKGTVDQIVIILNSHKTEKAMVTSKLLTKTNVFRETSKCPVGELNCAVSAKVIIQAQLAKLVIRAQLAK